MFKSFFRKDLITHLSYLDASKAAANFTFSFLIFTVTHFFICDVIMSSETLQWTQLGAKKPLQSPEITFCFALGLYFQSFIFVH